MRTLRIGLYCLLGGLAFAIASAGQGHLGWSYLSGILLASAFVPLARFGPRGIWGQFGAIFLALFVVGCLCTVSEAAVFISGQSAVAARNLAAGFGVYLIAAAVLTWLARLLKLSEASGPPPEIRPAWIAAVMVVLSGCGYVVYYAVFGGIAYTFFTKQYYPHAQELAASLGSRLWLIELARGILMTLAVLPVICTLRMPRWAAAISVGVLLWIVGGGAPLLVPNTLMVPAQRYIHIVEILTQNAALGITAVLLLRRRVSKSQSQR